MTVCETVIDAKIRIFQIRCINPVLSSFKNLHDDKYQKNV